MNVNSNIRNRHPALRLIFARTIERLDMFMELQFSRTRIGSDYLLRI